MARRINRRTQSTNLFGEVLETGIDDLLLEGLLRGQADPLRGPQFATGGAPFIETSPGVFESPDRVADREDPRQDFFDEIVGKEPTELLTSAIQSPTAGPSQDINDILDPAFIQQLLAQIQAEANRFNTNPF